MTSSSKGSRDGGVARRVAVFAATVIVAYAAASVATTREGLARVVLSTTKTNDGRAPMWAKEGHAPLKAFFNDAMADAPTGLTRDERRAARALRAARKAARAGNGQSETTFTLSKSWKLHRLAKLGITEVLTDDDEAPNALSDVSFTSAQTKGAQTAFDFSEEEAEAAPQNQTEDFLADNYDAEEKIETSVDSVITSSPDAVFAAQFGNHTCVQQCADDADVAQIIGGSGCTALQANDNVFKCLNEKCSCEEAVALHETLLYVCDANEVGKNFSFVRLNQFYVDTLDEAIDECQVTDLLDSVVSSQNTYCDSNEDQDSTISNVTAAALGQGCHSGGDRPPVANCILHKYYFARCDYWAGCRRGCNSWDYPIRWKHCGWCCHRCVNFPCGVNCRCRCRRRRWGWRCRCSCHTRWCRRCWHLPTYRPRCRKDRYYRQNKCDICSPGYGVTRNGQCQLYGWIQAIVDGINAVKQGIEYIKNAIPNTIDNIKNMFTNVKTQANTAVTKLTELADQIAQKVTDLADEVVSSVIFIKPATFLQAIESALLSCDNAQSALGSTKISAHEATSLGLLDPANSHVLEEKLGDIFGKSRSGVSPIQEWRSDDTSSLGVGQCVAHCGAGMCLPTTIPAMKYETPDHGMPFPDSIHLVKYKPDAVIVNVAANPVSVCVKMTEFSIPTTAAESIVNALVDQIKPILLAGVDEVKQWGKNAAKGMKNAAVAVEDGANDMAGFVQGIPDKLNNLVGRRRLLADATPSDQDLIDVSFALGRLMAQQNRLREKTEADVRLSLDELRARLQALPHFSHAHPTHKGAANHATANLGGNFLSDASDGLVNAMKLAFQDMKNMKMIARSTLVLDLNVEFNTDATAYRFDDLLNNGEGYTMMIDQSIPIGLGFTIAITGRLDVKMPYYFIAESAGNFAYNVASNDFWVEFGSDEGSGVLRLNDNPQVTITPSGTGQSSVSFKVSTTLRASDFKVSVCFGDIICSGIEAQFFQSVSAGADSLSATTDEECFNGATEFKAMFADTFTGYYDENSGECRLRQRGSINAAGQYVEIPKPDVNVAFTTVVLGDKDCVSPVSLYEYSARESWLSDAQMATLTSKTCAAPADGDGDFVTSSCSACDTARAQGCHS